MTIVNQTFVRRFLHNGLPLGRRIRQGQPGRQGPWLEVVGVVEDAAYRSVRDPAPPTLVRADGSRRSWGAGGPSDPSSPTVQHEP